MPRSRSCQRREPVPPLLGARRARACSRSRADSRRGDLLGRPRRARARSRRAGQAGRVLVGADRGDPGAQRGPRSSAASRSRASRRSAWIDCGPARDLGLAAQRLELAAQLGREVGQARSMLACIASSLRSAFSLRLRCLRIPAASSTNARRSSGRDWTMSSSWPCPTRRAAHARCPSRPAAPGRRAGGTSSPLISYSLAPSRKTRPADRAPRRTRSAARRRRCRSSASPRPGRGRPRRSVPAKMTSSILPPRSALAPCSPRTQRDRVDDVGLARAVGPDHAGDAGLEAQRRRRGERLEALERQALEVHGPAPPDRRPGARGRYASPPTPPRAPAIRHGAHRSGGVRATRPGCDRITIGPDGIDSAAVPA